MLMVLAFLARVLAYLSIFHILCSFLIRVHNSLLNLFLGSFVAGMLVNYRLFILCDTFEFERVISCHIIRKSHFCFVPKVTSFTVLKAKKKKMEFLIQLNIYQHYCRN